MKSMQITIKITDKEKSPICKEQRVRISYEKEYGRRRIGKVDVHGRRILWRSMCLR